ncbi:TrkH family potassium uptake protein [Xylanivirga thermophila]|uniref:TrkH family potassium uptake protein n=1 Tax=Xylanivirga thermophila TaxID=2496273 RepID=UPI001FB260DD|nr:TrkH family potassium uptake protein [Xylanivirga thermophila]
MFTDKMVKKRTCLSPTQVLAIGFASIILIGGILLSLPVASANGQSIGFINSLFEATSAVCVTGLVVVDTGTDLSLFGQIVIITLIQIGGLGFMTAASLIFLALGKRITLRERLVMQEALNQFNLEGLVRLTKNVIGVTFIIEGIGALLLSTRFIPLYGFKKGLYYSIFHAISAFCNAGFDLIGNYRNLTGFVDDVVINMTVMGLIILGGLGFSVILDIWHHRRFKKLSLHSKLAVFMTVMLILIGTAFFFIVEYNNPYTLADKPLPIKILASLFQSVTPRTAGFNTIDQANLKDASKFMTILLMFIGASPASTGGGIKTVTASVIFFLTVSVVRGRDDIQVYGKRISHSIAHRAITITLISLMLLIGVSMVLSLIEPQPFIDILFETSSALGTVGLASFDNGSMSTISKIFVMLTMFAGRVGPLTLTLALAKRQNQSDNSIRYPEGKVMVG